MPLRAVLWDVDGTLLDSAPEHFAAWAAFFAARGVPYSRAEFDRTFGWRNPEILRELLDPNLGDDDCRALGEEKEVAYRELVRRGAVRLLPGVRELLDGFRALGVPQAVGSSAPSGNLDLLLSAAGIAGYFGAVVSGDDVRRGKPDPEVFLLGAAKLGVSAAGCLVVEDAVAGVQAARAAGMACLAVLSGHHHTAESLGAAGAARVVASLAEISAPAALGLAAG